MTKDINSMIVKYDNMKTDAGLEKTEFRVTYRRKNFLERIKEGLADLKLRLVVKYLNWRIRKGDESVIETLNQNIREGKLEVMSHEKHQKEK